MTDRGIDGKFVKGNKAGPGRPPKALNENFKALIDSAVTEDDWLAIILKARDLAKKGDAVAREYLTSRRFGKVPDKHEIMGENGGPVQVARIEMVLPPEDEPGDSTT